MDVSETMNLARAAPRQTKTETKKQAEKASETFQDTLTEKVNNSTPTKKEEPEVRVEKETEETSAELNKKQEVNVDVVVQQMAPQISLLNNQMEVVDGETQTESETSVDEQQALIAAAMDALFSADEETETTTATQTEEGLSAANFTSEIEESMSALEVESESLSKDAGLDLTEVNTEVEVAVNKEEVTDANLFGLADTGQNTNVNTTTSTVNVTEEFQNVNMDQLLNQVETKIQTMIKTGENTFSIKVHPENLGQINIKLVSGSDGLQVYLSAEKPATGALLESGIEQLQEILNTAGVNIGNMSVGYQQPQGSNEETAQWLNMRNIPGGLELSSEQAELLSNQITLGQTSMTALDYSA